MFKLGLVGAAAGVVGPLVNGSVLISAKVFGASCLILRVIFIYRLILSFTRTTRRGRCITLSRTKAICYFVLFPERLHPTSEFDEK